MCRLHTTTHCPLMQRHFTALFAGRVFAVLLLCSHGAAHVPYRQTASTKQHVDLGDADPQSAFLAPLSPTLHHSHYHLYAPLFLKRTFTPYIIPRHRPAPLVTCTKNTQPSEMLEEGTVLVRRKKRKPAATQ